MRFIKALNEDTIKKLSAAAMSVPQEKLKQADDFDKYVNELVAKAEKVEQKIEPTNGAQNFRDCITHVDDKLYLWFNKQNKTTSIVSVDIKEL